MFNFRQLMVTGAAFVMLLAPSASFAKTPTVPANPPVKRSLTMICHAKGTRYYHQTKYFVPFGTLKTCLKSGGRLPK